MSVLHKTADEGLNPVLKFMFFKLLGESLVVEESVIVLAWFESSGCLYRERVSEVVFVREIESLLGEELLKHIDSVLVKIENTWSSKPAFRSRAMNLNSVARYTFRPAMFAANSEPVTAIR